MPCKHSRTSSPSRTMLAQRSGHIIWMTMWMKMTTTMTTTSSQVPTMSTSRTNPSRNDVEESLAQSAFVLAVRQASY